MGYPTKIATCCHCGSRAALTLEAGRHELSCANCGAPLRNFKMLPKAAPEGSGTQKGPTAISHQPQIRRFPESPRARAYKQAKSRKAGTRKGWFKDWVEDAFDLVEDIFD